MIVVDSNILVSAAAGRRTEPIILECALRGVIMVSPFHQFDEATLVLSDKLQWPTKLIGEALAELAMAVEPIEDLIYSRYEGAARQRLHHAAQDDWPVLAAALALDGGIWSNDRDFFGVGVPIWTTGNMRFAV